MCTAITFDGADHYFGRNLDLEYSYGESVIITPRNYPFRFRKAETMCSHYAMIGMALAVEDYPLYFDATNEHGLSMAGLNFPGNAVYQPFREGYDNITPFELIPWILSQCKTVPEAAGLLNNLNIFDEAFSNAYPQTPLHWILADAHSCIVLEPMEDGLRIHENPVGVLTNNPPFDYHMTYLHNYLHLSAKEPENRFSAELKLFPYSRGMGAFGLPGDLSSPSRFIRGAFVKFNAVRHQTENESVGQFFHLLDTVAQVEGCCITPDGLEKTVYSSCCNTNKLVYYYCTYTNRQITAVKMLPEHMNGSDIISYPLVLQQQILWKNCN